MQAREDEEVKAQLIQTIDKLTSDNSCLKTEMDLVLKSQQEQRAKDSRAWTSLQVRQ